MSCGRGTPGRSNFRPARSAPCPVFGSRGSGGRLGRHVEGVVVPVAAPLPDVARHVVQAEGRHPQQAFTSAIGRRVGLIGGSLEVLAEPQSGRARADRRPRGTPGSAASGGVFPLRLGRQKALGLGTVVAAVVAPVLARWPRANRRLPRTTRRGSLATVRCPRSGRHSDPVCSIGMWTFRGRPRVEYEPVGEHFRGEVPSTELRNRQ